MFLFFERKRGKNQKIAQTNIYRQNMESRFNIIFIGYSRLKQAELSKIPKQILLKTKAIIDIGKSI